MTEGKFRGILESIAEYIREKPIRMHMPGHKGLPGNDRDGEARVEGGVESPRDAWPDVAVYNPESILSLARLMDLTEIPGLDNLHYPREAIRRLEERFASLFGVERTYLLVNGATSGILAALLGLRMTFGRGLVLLPRNVHRSVISGIIISGLEPLFIYPEFDEELGGYLPLDSFRVTKTLGELTGSQVRRIRGLLLVNPTYHGIARSLGEICQEIHGVSEPGVPVIADEAHGTHFKFSRILPPSAIDFGADLVIHGTHKTTRALTQTGLLHVTCSCESRFPDLARNVKEALRLVQSSSPSYILMASLEDALKCFDRGGSWVQKGVLLGRELSERLSLIPGIRVVRPSPESDLSYDPGRVSVTVSGLGISGAAAQEFLWNRWRIRVEMIGPDSLLLLVTGSDDCHTVEIVERAFRDLSQAILEGGSQKAGVSGTVSRVCEPPRPKRVMPLAAAFFSPVKELDLGASLGRISGDTIVMYPPGIPVLVPGEKIDENVVQYIEWARRTGLEVMGRAYSGSKVGESELKVACVESS